MEGIERTQDIISKKALSQFENTSFKLFAFPTPHPNWNKLIKQNRSETETIVKLISDIILH